MRALRVGVNNVCLPVHLHRGEDVVRKCGGGAGRRSGRYCKLGAPPANTAQYCMSRTSTGNSPLRTLRGCSRVAALDARFGPAGNSNRQQRTPCNVTPQARGGTAISTQPSGSGLPVGRGSSTESESDYADQAVAVPVGAAARLVGLGDLHCSTTKLNDSDPSLR